MRKAIRWEGGSPRLLRQVERDPRIAEWGLRKPRNPGSFLGLEAFYVSEGAFSPTQGLVSLKKDRMVVGPVTVVWHVQALNLLNQSISRGWGGGFC